MTYKYRYSLLVQHPPTAPLFFPSPTHLILPPFLSYYPLLSYCHHLYPLLLPPLFLPSPTLSYLLSYLLPLFLPSPTSSSYSYSAPTLTYFPPLPPLLPLLLLNYPIPPLSSSSSSLLLHSLVGGPSFGNVV